VRKRFKAGSHFEDRGLGLANSRQANNNLLSFPYGGRFKKRKRTGEKPIKLRLSEAPVPEKAVLIEPEIAPGRLHGRGPGRYPARVLIL
jgi:hypothetical protein